jgi:hypothetical protein
MLNVAAIDDACAEAGAVAALLRRNPSGVPPARLLILAGIWLDLAGAAFGPGDVGDSLVDMANDVTELVAGLQP